MEITSKLINDIFTLKVSLTKQKDKDKLSQYQKIIPLYDIITNLIYPIPFEEIEDKILNKHYRFIDYKLETILNNNITNIKDLVIKKNLYDEELELFQKIIEKIDYNIKIIKNYNLDILRETNIKAFYYGSTNLGQSVSICRRISFHPLLKHLSPYWNLKELLKMGQNLNTKGLEDITPIKLQDSKLHYEICNKISKNDIKNINILNHLDYLFSEKKIFNMIKYFSIYGSFFVNSNLRYYQKNNSFSNIPFPQYLNYTNEINNVFDKSPGLDKEYYLYRFIQDDSFISHLKKGDIFVEAGIMSTTRNPFYSPDELEKFGIILFKIIVPKEFDKLLLIESISAFPQEQEIIFPPYTKLKLVGKDKDFKYFHTNEKIERKIVKRYQFKVVGQDKVPLIPTNNLTYKLVDINSKLFAPNFKERKKEFLTTLTNNGLLKIVVNNKIINFYAMTFDSLGAYKKIYYNKDDDGIILFCFDDYNMKYGIEISNELVFNFQERFFPDTLNLTDDEIYNLLGVIGKLFGYTTAKVFLPYTKNKDVIYPKIFDTSKSFNSNKLKYGFSDREFKTKINQKINLIIHPNKNFNLGFKTWQDFFNFSKNNYNLENFYLEWNENFEENIIESLYSHIDLTDFYQENNLDFEKITVNKSISDITRYRQSI